MQQIDRIPNQNIRITEKFITGLWLPYIAYANSKNGNTTIKLFLSNFVTAKRHREKEREQKSGFVKLHTQLTLVIE